MELANKVKNGAGYSSASVAISIALIALVVYFVPDMKEIEAILVAGLTPIMNVVLVLLKNKVYGDN